MVKKSTLIKRNKNLLELKDKLISFNFDLEKLAISQYSIRSLIDDKNLNKIFSNLTNLQKTTDSYLHNNLLLSINDQYTINSRILRRISQ